MKLLNHNSGFFFKMQGSGNDFILWDNNTLNLSRDNMSLWAKTLCPRAFAVGADGMIFLESDSARDMDYIWHFYNADGTRAEMCGNGSRCAARLAYELGFAGKKQVFGTDAGPVSAQILEHGHVQVQLTPARDLQLHTVLPIPDNQAINVHFVNTGVPHAVVICEEAEKVKVSEVAPKIRWHEHFDPVGANVNFVQVQDQNRILLRTYERGVEDETFACGTGAAASVVVATALNLCVTPVQVRTMEGEELTIDIQGDYVYLTGKADFIYQAEVFLDTFGLSLPQD